MCNKSHLNVKSICKKQPTDALFYSETKYVYYDILFSIRTPTNRTIWSSWAKLIHTHWTCVKIIHFSAYHRPIWTAFTIIPISGAYRKREGHGFETAFITFHLNISSYKPYQSYTICWVLRLFIFIYVYRKN